MANIFKFLGNNILYLVVFILSICLIIGASFLYKYLVKKLEEKKEKAKTEKEGNKKD